jgi:tight adherence protein B
MELLLALLTFVIVMAVLGGVLLLVGGGRRQEVIRRRLESIEKAQKRGSVALELQLVRDELLSDVPAIHQMLMRMNWTGKLRTYIGQAGMKIKPGKLILVTAIVAIGAGVLAHYSYHIPIATGIAAVVGVFVPITVVAFRRRQRLRAFERNFPEAIDLLGRAIRAGHAISTGMEMISKELPEPVSDEFRVTFEEQNFGLPMKDAMLNLAERVPLIDVRFFVSALLIQKETGGNLAEILDTLSRVIRERFKIYGDVRTRTAQGRLTAGILIALPPMMMVALGTLNPPYIRVLFDDPVGPWTLGVAALMQVLGTIMLWRIVNIEV